MHIPYVVIGRQRLSKPERQRSLIDGKAVDANNAPILFEMAGGYMSVRIPVAIW
jgi:hypothetical protein